MIDKMHMMRDFAAAALLGLAVPVLAQANTDKPAEKAVEKTEGKASENKASENKAGEDKVSDIDKIGKTAENIATKPLKDLNLMKDEIPPEVLAVMKAPYSLKGIKGCSQYRAAIGRLTELLLALMSIPPKPGPRKARMPANSRWVPPNRSPVASSPAWG